jgi:hypothetical protein
MLASSITRRNFFEPGELYPELRRAFVYKEKPARTPPHLARHRTGAIAEPIESSRVARALGSSFGPQDFGRLEPGGGSARPERQDVRDEDHRGHHEQDERERRDGSGRNAQIAGE